MRHIATYPPSKSQFLIGIILAVIQTGLKFLRGDAPEKRRFHHFMLWKTSRHELRSGGVPRPQSIQGLISASRIFQLTFFALAAGGLLNFALGSFHLQLNIPIRQLHVAWNLTRILIEF